MEHVTRQREDDLLQAFIKKHGLLKIETTPMKYNRYSKIYIGEDYAEFTEVNTIVWEKAIAEIHGLKIEVMVKLFQTEFYSTDDATSRYVYERV